MTRTQLTLAAILCLHLSSLSGEEPKPKRGRVEMRFLSPDLERELDLEVTLRGFKADRWVGDVVSRKALVVPPRPKNASLSFRDLAAGRYLLAWEGPEIAREQRSIELGEGLLSLGTLVLEPGLTLEGSVLDDLDVPIGDVQVRLGVEEEGRPFPEKTYDAVSDQKGSFAVRGLPPGKTMTWSATAKRHVTDKGIWGGETHLALVLQRAQEITGRIEDPDGNPVPGALVSIGYRLAGAATSGRDPQKSSADGSFALFREMSWPATLRVDASRFQTVRKSLGALTKDSWPKEMKLGTITLARGRELRGRVVSSTSESPLPGVRVVADWEEGTGPDRRRWARDQTDGEGRFELGGLPEKGSVFVTASLEGHAPSTRKVSDEEESLELALGRGGRIEGQICGTPHELSRSEIWYGWESHVHSSANTIAVDSSGRFVLELAEPGRYSLSRAWVNREGSVQSGNLHGEATVVEGQTTRVKLGCDGILVSGAITKGGRPVALRVVRFALDEVYTVAETVPDENGRFTVRVPRPGKLGIWGEAPGRAPTCEVPVGGNDSCLLDLTSP